MASAAEEVRDDIIHRDVIYRRVDASIRREVDARLDQLGKDLKSLMFRIDVAGTSRASARKRRLRRLNEESRILIRTAYTEMGAITRSALRRVGKVEAVSTAQIMRKQIP